MNSYITSIAYNICFILISISTTTFAQTDMGNTEVNSLSLEDCYLWTRENFPLVKQLDLIDKTLQYSLSNASKGNLPQINLNGQATYQSEVTQLPIEFPNMEIPAIDKDQYKVYAEVFQPLTRFSNVKTRKELIRQQSQVEKQEVEVDLYKMKNRINKLYFGVLLINEKIEQYLIIQSEIDSTLVKVQAAINNGTATLTDKQLLNVERISLDQKIEEDRANKSAFIEVLAVLTKKNITQKSVFKVPNNRTPSTIINRPELQLFNLQSQTIELQQKQLSNSLIPNAGLFGQGGYGRPALNFLSNDFDFYYLVGVKMNWNISSLYQYKNTKKTLALLTEKIASQKEVFLLNTSLTQTQQTAETKKYTTLIKSDKAIIEIREQILNTAKVQLNNGLITTIDYLKFLNDVNRAKQTLLLHKTQLLLSQYNLANTTGN